MSLGKKNKYIYNKKKLKKREFLFFKKIQS